MTVFHNSRDIKLRGSEFRPSECGQEKVKDCNRERELFKARYVVSARTTCALKLEEEMKEYEKVFITSWG